MSERLLGHVARLFVVAAYLMVLGSSSGCGSGSSADGSAADSAGAASAKSSEGDEGDEEKKEERKPRERTTSVQVSKALVGSLVIPVIAEGTIRARHSAELRTEIAGRIVRIATEEGRYVRRGALIAKLDDREYEIALAEARAKYVQALSLLAIEEDQEITIPERPPDLQKQIDELERLERKGVITREERLAREIALDMEALKEGYYRLDVVTARSGIAEARAALERARLTIEKTEIRAPFNGVVTGIELSDGEQVMANEVLCTLVNNTDIEAQVGVLESDVGKLSVGRPALLVVPALGDTLDVTVDVISPQFDRASRTCDVLLRVKNPDGRVRPGMFARAIIAGETFRERLLVPKEAILTRDGRPLLFKVEDDRARWLYLRLGRENDNVVEVERVLQGGTLGPDDLVVVADHLTLSHDAKVKVKKVVPVQDPWGARSKDI